MCLEMHAILKTFMGRSHKEFDLLGYHFTLQGLSPNLQTQEKGIEKAKHPPLAQGGIQSLQLLLYPVVRGLASETRADSAPTSVTRRGARL